MKSKPILFSTDMVKKILSREKTVTRRIIKPQPKSGVFLDDGKFVTNSGKELKSLKGDVNGKLWVRETWSENPIIKSNTIYLADGEDHGGIHVSWKPSIHMPMDRARIILNITEKPTIERLYDDITARECLNEGMGWDDPVESFRKLWNTLNGEWDAVTRMVLPGRSKSIITQSGEVKVFNNITDKPQKVVVRYECFPFSKEDVPSYTKEPDSPVRIAYPNPYVWRYKFEMIKP